MKATLRAVALVSILVLTACRDEGTAPPIDNQDPPAAFQVEGPESVVQGQPFPLTISALDAAGLPETTWSGTVALSTSGGTLSPSSAQLVNGTVTVQVTLSGHAGAVTLRAAAGNAQSPPWNAMVLSGEPPARLEIVPGAALLPASGATQPFEVRAYDAQGEPTTAAQVEWRSTNAATLTIDAGGVATAQVGAGSAQIIAEADGVESTPALVLVAQPAAGTVLLADSQIVTDPVAVDAAAEYGPGWQYRVRVQNAAPAVGELVIGTGERPLAGRIVATADAGGETELTVELIPLNQLLTEVVIKELIPLVELEPGSASGQARMRVPSPEMPAGFQMAGVDFEFERAGFQCKGSGEAPSLDLPEPTLEVENALALDLVYDGGLQRLIVTGDINANFGYKPVLEAAFEGKLECERTIRTLTVPLSGAASWFFGIQVPVGVGFELNGKIEIAEVGFDVSAEASAHAQLGMTCTAGGGPCTAVTEFGGEKDGSFELIAPDVSDQFRIGLAAHGYLFAKPAIGSAFSEAAQFEFLSATAGLEQTLKLALPEAQAAEPDSASEFALAAVLKIGAGEGVTSAIETLGDLLGMELTINTTIVDESTDIAESPRGTFTITPASVVAGDSVGLGDMTTFKVELDPVRYLGLYSVDKVEFFWRHTNEDSALTLGPGRPACTEISAEPGQTTFECETDFLNEHIGEQTFHAFVHAKLFGVSLPIPLEIAADGSARVNVGGECPVAPDWATPAMFRDVYLPDNPGTATGEILTAEYNRMSVAATVETDTFTWVTSRVSVEAQDWVYILPLESVDPLEPIFLPIHLVAEASARASDHTDSRAEAGSGMQWTGGAVASGELDPGNESVMTRDTVIMYRMAASNLNEWTYLDASARTYTRVRVPGSSGSASSAIRFDFMDYVETQDGTRVPIQVCSASGTAY